VVVTLTGFPICPATAGTWSLLSYDKDVEGHPANKDFVLRMMTVPAGYPEVLTHLFGGQGTMNVPS